jgi:hypothetical protein
LQTSRIIDEARALARDFVARGRDQVRLPVFAFEDWRKIYGKPSDGPALNSYRTQTRRSWYLFRFLREMGVEVLPTPVRAGAFLDWAAQGERNLEDGHELAHAVGEYVNHPGAPTTQCRPAAPPGEALVVEGPRMATITTFGETAESPEVLSVALHRPDGEVIATLEVLGSEHGAEEAWQKATEFLDRCTPQKVFHDRTVRRPEFCADCNALLVNVASAKDIEASGG